MNKYIAALLVGFVTSQVTAASYRIADLGMPGRTASGVTLNDRGQVVVTFYPEFIGDLEINLFHDKTAVIDVTSVFKQGRLITEQGALLGIASNIAGSTVLRRFENGTVNDLRTFSNDSTRIAAINEDGDFVGTIRVGTELRAFVSTLSSNIISDIGSLGGGFTAPTDLNNRGQIVGVSWTKPPSMASTNEDVFQQAFLYDNGIMVELGLLGGRHSIARGINDLGTVVGESAVSPNGPIHAFVYDGINGMRSIGLQGLDSVADDINEFGVIVGSAERWPDIRRAALFHETNGIQFLEDLIPLDSGWERLIRATDVNNHGQIAGLGVINGETHAFLLSPIPEPCSLVLVVISALLVTHRFRRLPMIAEQSSRMGSPRSGNPSNERP